VFSQPGALGPCGGVLSASAPWWCSLSQGPSGPVVVFSQPGPRGGVLSAWAPWCCSLSLGPVVLFSRPGPRGVLSTPGSPPGRRKALRGLKCVRRQVGKSLLEHLEPVSRRLTVLFVQEGGVTADNNRGRLCMKGC
jgi:hypothetical protein